MSIEIKEASLDQKSILRNLLELYLYDFSEYIDIEVGEDGLYGYPPLEYYWNEPGRHAFLVRAGGRLAGFVLVRTHPPGPDGGEVRSIAEFFILRKYRRKGLGEEVARRIFDRFPGDWRVAQIVENPQATAFWRKVIDRYTGGRYTEVFVEDEHWRGPEQVFNNSRKPQINPDSHG
jgi:predicted acetyltransferase